MSIQNFLKFIGIVVLFSGATWATQSLSLVLLGNETDPYSVRISKDFSMSKNNIKFQICDSIGNCRTLGSRGMYDNCQIIELTKTPWWAIILDGGEVFAKAGGSWAGFAKKLVSSDSYEFTQSQLERQNPIRVTNYLGKTQAAQVTVLNESKAIEQALSKVDHFTCE